MSGPSAVVARDLTRRVAHVMGMPISLAMDGRHARTPAGERAWADAFASLQEADSVFSTYWEDSVISRLGRGAIALDDCPEVVHEVLALAEVARAESGGAFDVWRKGPDGVIALDPSGIVKGWAVDRAADYLRQLDETDFCLSAGGDMVCATARAESPDWRVGIEDPRDPAQVLAAVPIRNGAIATSGFAHRGEHIVDPRTDETPRTFASVTVIAETLSAADVDATAAFVLGEEGPGWMSGRRHRSAFFVRGDGTILSVPSVG